MKAKYYPHDIEVSKQNNGYYLSWKYGDRLYDAWGDFYIDKKGYLHNTFFTPKGSQREIKVKVLF